MEALCVEETQRMAVRARLEMRMMVGDLGCLV